MARRCLGANGGKGRGLTGAKDFRPREEAVPRSCGPGGPGVLRTGSELREAGGGIQVKEK